MNATAVVTSLSTMSAKERTNIRLALEVLDKGERTSQVNDNSDTAAFVLWNQLVSVGAERGVALPHVERASRMKAFSAFKKDAEAAEEFLRKHVSMPDKTTRMHAFRICARALLRRMTTLRNDIGMQITPGVVMRQAINIPAAIQQQWPHARELRHVLRIA